MSKIPSLSTNGEPLLLPAIKESVAKLAYIWQEALGTSHALETQVKLHDPLGLLSEEEATIFSHFKLSPYALETIKYHKDALDLLVESLDDDDFALEEDIDSIKKIPLAMMIANNTDHLREVLYRIEFITGAMNREELRWLTLCSAIAQR